ncbi:MAG TPA: SIR2 family protein [Candidatus Angelobacter sp.]|jgi:hypothetical protein|nr:SIR2 family protein [Candidatus Angelobacter sp.]
MDPLTATRGHERDISFVLVTGAGASRDLGARGSQLPLMGDWSDFLVKKLAAHPAYLEASGLKNGMLGEDFEAQLGRFLQQVRAFPLISEVLAPSVQFQQTPGLSEPLLKQWHQQAEFHLQAIVDLIHQSLYEQFGTDAFDLQGAIQAYGALFQTLQINSATPFVCATTNYDPIAEHAITGQGWLADWGEPHTPHGEAPIDVHGLLDAMPRYVPILHLHGRVGWYRRTEPDTRVYATTTTQHQRGFGTPIVMLPDPNKVYDDDDVINTLWQQFAEALARARRVLVLGHSLNDRAVLRALTQNVQPLTRVGVTVLASDDRSGTPHESATPVMDTVRQHLAGAETIPVRFGRGAAEMAELATWVANTGAFL